MQEIIRNHQNKNFGSIFSMFYIPILLFYTCSRKRGEYRKFLITFFVYSLNFMLRQDCRPGFQCIHVAAPTCPVRIFVFGKHTCLVRGFLVTHLLKTWKVILTRDFNNIFPLIASKSFPGNWSIGADWHIGHILGQVSQRQDWQYQQLQTY